jgi:hypothetical protein
MTAVAGTTCRSFDFDLATQVARRSHDPSQTSHAGYISIERNRRTGVSHSAIRLIRLSPIRPTSQMRFRGHVPEGRRDGHPLPRLKGQSSWKYPE